MTFSIATTFGAVLIGGYCNAVLAGAVIVQTFLYIKLFPDDSVGTKTIVGAVCALDGAHTILVCLTAWGYLITHYGDEHSIEAISIPLALTGVTTAILTFIVHCFYSHRIYKLNQHRLPVTMLIMLLSLFRLCCASVSSAEMMELSSMDAFLQKRFWTFFTLGLATSCFIDILIAGFLTYTLKALQKGQNPLGLDHRMAGAVLMYTLENNMLTSIVAIVAMMTWLMRSDTFISVGIHFSICKMYTNSLLATLNARKQPHHQLQRDASGGPPELHRLSNMSRGSRSTRRFSSRAESPAAPTQLEIAVEKSIQFDVDECLSYQSRKKWATLEPQAT